MFSELASQDLPTPVLWQAFTGEPPWFGRELASGEGSRPQGTRLFWRYQGYSLRKSALKKPEGDATPSCI